MRLKELTIAGFRGFRLKRTIPLDADIVVIHGPNGSGKSSIVEAVEWLLFGDISRHRRAKSPMEYAGEYLRNVHCHPTDLTFVEARVVLDGRELTIRREYQSARRPPRILIDGNKVGDLSAVGIDIEWDTKPILSQGEIKDFVDTEQKDRYSEIAYILGLDVLSEFRRSLMDLRNNMNGDATISQSIKLRDARAEDLRQYEELGSLSDTIVSSPYNHQDFLKNLYSRVKDVSGIKVRSLSECQKVLKAKYDSIAKTSPQLSKLSGLWISEDPIPTSELLKSLREIAKICDQLKSIAAQQVEAQKARFLADGLRLISDSTCPFCLQTTMTEARMRQIDAYLKTYKKGLKLEDELRESLEKFSALWRIVSQDLCARVGIQAAVKTALDEAIAVLGTTPDTNALTKFHDVKLPDLQTQVDEVNKQVEKFEQSCDSLLDHQLDLSMKKLTTLANRIGTRIEGACTNVYREVTALASLKLKMLSSTPGLLPETVKKIQMASALESVVVNSGHVRLAGTYDNRSSALGNLQTKIEEFEKARMRQMLGDLSNDISHYYDKFNPGEPIRFTRLAITSPIQRHVRIQGEAFGKDLNPVSCFSEAHVNCLGLSLYFCQRVKRNLQWQVFVLDDPIQSMDEQHAERLVDTLREISQDKQLIVLTQQKALCDMLDDVFQGQRYIKYNCGPYSIDGPQIESEIESIERNLELAKTFSRGSKDDRISKSAGSIRKAMEAIVKELLVTNCRVTKASLRTQQVRLSRRLGQLEKSGFDGDDIVSMRTILPIIDKPHHDDPNWDIHPQKIDRAVEILKSVCEKHKIGPFRASRTMVGRVVNYLPKIGVAIVEVSKPFSVGENLMIEGTTTCIQMLLESLELDRKRITSAEIGAAVGMKVPDQVRANDLVYKIVEK